LWNQDTEIHFLYAGLYKRKSNDKKYAIHKIADVLRERREDFRPTDVVVANIGNDYGDSKAYKQSLLKFLRTYEDIKGDPNAPMVLWRESSAQHHAGHVGGDILRPLGSWTEAEKEKGAQQQAQLLERSVKEKSAIHCHAIRGDDLIEGNWRNEMANRLMESAGIHILRVWKSTSMKYNWYRSWCKDSDLLESKGAHCERWGPCKHHCNPGVVTSFNELFLTFVDSPVISKDLRQREKRVQMQVQVGSTEEATTKSYHRVLVERMMKVFLSTNEIWPFNNQAQINPGAGEKVKWDKLESVGKNEEKYWNEKRKEAAAFSLEGGSKAETSPKDKASSSKKKSSHKKNG
jgi:hypothetical protein